MNEMVLRAAKAIRAKVPYGYGMTGEEAIAYAQAVLAEIRSANGLMAEAGANALNPYVATSREFSDNVELALDTWQAMIDEASK